MKRLESKDSFLSYELFKIMTRLKITKRRNPMIMNSRMYLLKAICNEMEYEATFFYFKSVLEIVHHLHKYYKNLRVSVSLIPNADPDLYHYEFKSNKEANKC